MPFVCLSVCLYLWTAYVEKLRANFDEIWVFGSLWTRKDIDEALGGWCYRWRGGATDWASRRTCDQEVAGSTPGRGVTTLGKLFGTENVNETECRSVSTSHHCGRATKQYNLVPANGRWHSAAGKVTVGLASHWPCVTESSGLSTYGLKA